MQNKLQELTDKLYNEGLSKGKQEGEEILAKAKVQAEEIIAKAKAEAEAIVAAAHKDAADLKTKVEGENDPELTYTVTGLVGSDTIVCTLTREPGETPGTYDIIQDALRASDNYNISFTKGTLTITAKPSSWRPRLPSSTRPLRP